MEPPIFLSVIPWASRQQAKPSVLFFHAEKVGYNDYDYEFIIHIYINNTSINNNHQWMIMMIIMGYNML